MTEQGDVVAQFTGIRKNFWYVNEAVLAGAFYLTGYLFRNYAMRTKAEQIDYIVLLLSGFVFFATFDLNSGPFLDKHPVVAMSASSHGNMFLLYTTACAGSLMLLSLCRLVAVHIRPIQFIGRNTIIFLGLNGLSYHFIDDFLIKRIGYIPVAGMEVFLYSFIFSACMMLAYFPIVYVFREYVPELAGVKWKESSLLGPLSMERVKGNRYFQRLLEVVSGR